MAEESATKTILVTGGTGLVGKAIEYIISNEREGSRFGRRPGEKWVFASSKDGDLRCVVRVLRILFERTFNCFY